MVACLVCWEIGASAARAEGLPLIRDSEIEDTIRSWANPLLQAAQLDPSSVRLLIVNDQTLNAFVAGGQNLFINSGLLVEADTPGQLLGVLAHETGHISGGHLARSGDALRDAQNAGLFATLLGIGLIALGAATGSGEAGDAGSAVVVGGQSAGLRNFLAYTRSQERSADQAAVNLLDRTGQSSEGMLHFMEKLADQELLSSSRQDPYVRSHPLTRDRIEFISEHARNSQNTDRQNTPEDIERHERMRAKLIGFLERPRRVLRTFYPTNDQSLVARYGRAVAYLRLSDVDKAVAEMDSLIAERPNDPYFYELKGQILYELGHIREAVPMYQKAVALKPGDGLMLTGLGAALLETGDPAYVDPAIEALEQARRNDVENPSTWRLLATGYHARGDDGPAALASAEYALLIGRAQDARLHAGRAERIYQEGSPGWLRSQDIKFQAEQLFAIEEKARG
jgi:predicted Zn-dependent protease